MTTNLLTTGGVDFDNCFEAGSGTQLLYIYTPDGTDIGKKYYPASAGSKYGTTGMLAPSGTDVGNLLCKKGTRDDGSVIMTVGTDGQYYGYKLGYYGAVNRRPYWNLSGGKVYLEALIYRRRAGKHTLLYVSSNLTAEVTISVNGVAFNILIQGDGNYGLVLSDPLGLNSGGTKTLYFSPAPAGFA